MRINHNIAALNTYRQLTSNNEVGNKSLEKLSSGLRINRAGDDAAGLAISEKMRAQIRGLEQASRNAQDAVSLIQTAEGGLNESHSILQRMRELATQAASDTNVDIDREEIQKEINQLTSEINRIGNTTEFNNMKLLNGGTSRTANIRYSVETSGVAGAEATGEVSAVDVLTGSVAAGTGAADIETNTGSVADSAVGEVDNWDQTADSVTAGTGEISTWTKVTDSETFAKAGEIGSPLTEMETSSTGGSVVIQKAAHLTGAAAYSIDAADITVDQLTSGSDGHIAKFTIDFGDFATGLQAGTEIQIGGQSFTAVANNAGTGQFKIGSTADETVANLAAAMRQNTGMWGSVTPVITEAGTSISIEAGIADTQITMGTFTTSGTTTAANIAAELDVQATKATYSFEVLVNFKAGDSITVGGETFIAKDGGASGSNEFNIGATIEATVAALQAKMQAHTAIGGGGYTVAVGGPGWGSGGADDANSITITKTATGVDAKVNQFTANLAATQGGPVAGTYKFELNTNFEAGSTIKIGDQTFTAVAAGGVGNTDKTFEVGGTLSDTATNLLAAINANAALSGKFHAAVLNMGNTAGGASIVGTGLATDADTIVLQEKLVSGDDMTTVVGGVASQDRAEQKASYKFELTTNFAEGDKITIGGTDFVAGTDFAIVEGDIDATLANLVTEINGSTLNAGFTASASGAELTIEENVADNDGSDVLGLGPAIVKRDEVKASYNFDITTNLVAGEKLMVGGKTFTAVDGGAVPADGTFDVSGGTTDDTAASLRAAMAAVLTDYTIGGAGSNITITEKNANAGGEADPLSGQEAAVSACDEVLGDYTVKLTENFSVGDKITIGGEEFTAVASGATGNQFAVGSNVNETTENLKGAIAGNGNLSPRFNVTVEETQVDPFTVTKEISLVEKGGKATGTDITLSIDNVDAVKGVYTFDIDTNFAVGDKVKINGQIFTAVDSEGENTDSTFIVGANASATTANLKAAIEENTTLAAAYNVLASGASIALSEKNASGEDLSNPQVLNGDGTAGEYKFQMSALKVGSTVTIDNRKLTLATGGTESETAAALKSAIEADATLKDKYAVAVSGAEVTLTQKEGQESAAAPILSYTTKAGDGYRAQMQIGANTGQSMSVDVNDMRADTLGVSSDAGTPGQTVEVEGKQYAVAWTSNQSVTNGTDDIAVEFALDVSTHDNATAAIKVINNAIERVSSERSKLGASQNRLEHTISNLGVSSENLTAAESRIRDVDMAKEMMEYTKMNILSQAAQAMLAQANQQPQQVLQLLR